MIDIKIEAIDEDDKPATVEVMASAGEFNGVVIWTKTPNGYTNVEFTQAQARELIAALQASVDYYAELEDL